MYRYAVCLLVLLFCTGMQCVCWCCCSVLVCSVSVGAAVLYCYAVCLLVLLFCTGMQCVCWCCCSVPVCTGMQCNKEEYNKLLISCAFVGSPYKHKCLFPMKKSFHVHYAAVCTRVLKRRWRHIKQGMLAQKTARGPLLSEQMETTLHDISSIFSASVHSSRIAQKFIELTDAREVFPPFRPFTRLESGQIAQSLQLLVYVPLSILSTQCIYVFRIIIE